MDYNLIMEGTDELKKMLYIFVCNDDDLLVRLYEGDRLMEKVQKEASRLKSCIDELLFYDGEEMVREVMKSWAENEFAKKTAVEMLKRNMNIQEIADITKLSPFEVEKLKRKINSKEL